MFSTRRIPALKTQISDTIASAREITDRAEADNRNLTAAEVDRVNAKLRAADALKQELAPLVKEHEQDQALRAQLYDLTGGMRPAVKGARFASYGEAVIKACSDGVHFKGISPAGSAVVGLPPLQIADLGRPVVDIRAIIPSEQTAGVVAYLRALSRTNAASVVAAGSKKPTSNTPLERVDDRVRTIATLSDPLNRFDLDDAPLLQQWVSDELGFMIEESIEVEVINGDGTGEHMTGLAHTSGLVTVAFSVNAVQTSRKAITAIESLGYDPDGWLMSPLDWERIELAATSTGSLLVTEAGQQAPIEVSARKLWGRSVYVCNAVPSGTAYLGAFQSAAKLYETGSVRIDWDQSAYSPDQFGVGQGGTLFQANQLVFRAETRAVLGVLRPNAIAKVSLAA